MKLSKVRVDSQVRRGGVDRASSYDALGLWFEPAKKNTTSLPRSPGGPPKSQAHPRISELSEMGGVKPKKIWVMTFKVCLLYYFLVQSQGTF